MTKVLFVRHGETNWNIEGRCQGNVDVPLSPIGQAQAASVAERLASKKIAAIYSSDLSRASETATAIAEKHSLPVQIAPALREIAFGDWEGNRFAELKDKHPDIMQIFNDRPGDVRIPNAETLSQVQDRAYRTVLDVVEKHADETIIIVSHGVALRTILCAALDVDLNKAWSFKLKNTAISTLVFHEDKIFLSSINDAHHLDDASAPENVSSLPI